MVSDLQPHSRFFRRNTPPLKVASDSWVCATRQLGMCKEGCFFRLSVTTPPHFLISKFANPLISLPLFRRSLLVTTPPLLGRSLRIGEYVIGVRIPFLSPRNPVFNIFCVAVSYYKPIIYTSFLYQSSKIRISFL